MAKFRRGGYVFVTWAGDHQPRHVHVYRDGRLIVKWDLEHWRAMRGAASARVVALIEELRDGEAVMTIRKVSFNNRRKVFDVGVGATHHSLPFSKVAPVPDTADPVKSVVVDTDTGRETFTFTMRSGRTGVVHVEQVLEYNKDPHFLRDALLYQLTIEAQSRVAGSPLSKREIMRRLGTSATQLYRLLDQTNYQKSIDQLLALLYVLDCHVDIKVSPTRRPKRVA